eukprot:TRINITY_DN2116_c0_g3_i1.p2 TRINITY_DN2116_c0_g3~~TRINITY_DN2116_c0_g3_i1.p2  ORF type:complete len:218 (+),score=53.25 TRINITY_DN2116_c0_g3_i1:68-721(+)
MAARMVATTLALLAAAAKPAGAATCVTATEGSCSIFACSAKRGVTDCVGGKCVCAEGYCQVNGKCVRGCEQQTPGTCRIFGCSSKRGVTDCVGGRCVCAPATCAVDGVCYDVCPRSTGGTCGWTGCSSSRGKTECVNGKCECRPGDCAVGGKCVTPSTINAAAGLPSTTDELVPALVAAAACGLASAVAASVAMWAARRMQASIMEEPLLLDAEAVQ